MTLRVPPRYQEANISELSRKIFSPVFDYVGEFEQRIKGGVGLLLSGPNGVGKTHALCALTREATKLYPKCGKYFDYEVVSAPDMFDRMSVFDDQKAMDQRRGKSWFETYATVPWLVIDDLGKELRTGGFHEQVVYKLGRILRARDGRCLVTHLSTNLPLQVHKDYDSLPSLYKQDIMSLLSQMVKGYQVNGPDRRKGG